MFFTYDKYVNHLYAQCRLKLETTATLELKKLFDCLYYPKTWHKHSDVIQLSVWEAVWRRLITDNIATLVQTHKGVFVKSLIHDNNVYIPRRNLCPTIPQ